MWSAPYSMRFIFGANEETACRRDVVSREVREPGLLVHARRRLPVCYGEKGGYDGCITSAPIADPVILDISGGVVTNAVPGEAWAVVRADASALPGAERITVADAGDGHGAHRRRGRERTRRLARAWHLRHHAVGELPAGERPVQPARTRVLGTRAKPRVRHHRRRRGHRHGRRVLRTRSR